jgi:Bacterial protein of unknown function (DUF885)
MGDASAAAAMSLTAFFESYYELRPVNATFTGVHDYDTRLPDWSPAGAARAVDAMRALRRSLGGNGSPSVDELRDVRARDRALAVAFLDVQVAEHESGHFQNRNPSLAAGEAIFSVVALMTRPFAPLAVRVDAAIARLSAIPTFLQGARSAVTRGVPDEWRLKAIRECDGAERLFGDAILRWLEVEQPDGAVSRQADRLRDASRLALAAFIDFRRWLARDAAADTKDYGCGAELFDLLLSRGHLTTRSRAALACDARSALEEALAEVDGSARAVAPGGWPEIQARLADVHPTASGYLSEYQHLWDACRERAEAAGLVTWPAYPIRYVPIPRHTREAAPFLYYLFYRSPAPYDRLPVHDYVVTPIEPDMAPDEQLRRLRATNTSVIKLNHVVHHGAIGHHVQNHYAYGGESDIGRVAAVDCASRIGMFGGGTMAEGWACYATDLMEEVGFLTAEESVAQQHTRARLLARAVVDIGLHERSMTFDEGVALYRDRIGMPPDLARAEACKNSMFPGTALMYWLGTDTLHALRRERERAEGEQFSLRNFHDRLLSYGSIPVPLIARLMLSSHENTKT